MTLQTLFKLDDKDFQICVLQSTIDNLQKENKKLMEDNEELRRQRDALLKRKKS